MVKSFKPKRNKKRVCIREEFSMYFRPCPFCGGTDIEIIDNYVMYAWCKNCHAHGPAIIIASFQQPKLAAQLAWNGCTPLVEMVAISLQKAKPK